MLKSSDDSDCGMNDEEISIADLILVDFGNVDKATVVFRII